MSDRYVNNEIKQIIKDNYLTYFTKEGKIKAEGPYINKMMEGKWTFYRATGELWQIGNFLNNKKHGLWVRYNKLGEIEYQKEFTNGEEKS